MIREYRLYFAIVWPSLWLAWIQVKRNLGRIQGHQLWCLRVAQEEGYRKLYVSVAHRILGRLSTVSLKKE